MLLNRREWYFLCPKYSFFSRVLHSLKNANPARQEQAHLEVENAEDDLVQKTEVAITYSRPVDTSTDRNKGVDMFIESLVRTSLRYVHGGVLTISRPQLPTTKGWPSITVVAFIIMPAATHSYTIEALKGQAVNHQTALRYRHRDLKQDWREAV